MADTVNAKISVSVKATYTKDLDLGDATDPIVKSASYSFTTLGAGASSYNQQWRDTRTLAAATNDDLDLAGSLTDAFGASVAFARFKVLAVWQTNANTADTHFRIGAAGTNPLSTLFVDTTDIIAAPRAGGCLIIVSTDATGYAVTAGSADALRIRNTSAGTSSTYDIALLGALT